MRVRIVSDGSVRGTRLEVKDDSVPVPTWKPLPHVQAIDWHLEARHGAKAVAVITVRGVPVEVEADAEIKSPLERLFSRTDRPKPLDTGQDQRN